MEQPNLHRMFVKLNIEHFNCEVPAIKLRWNRRLTTTSGYCRYSRNGEELEPTEISLSDKLFSSLGYPIDKIENTLVHEMTHAYLVHKYNERGHTRRFQEIMTRITGVKKNHRCHSYDVSAVRQKRTIAVHCQVCGNLGHRARMPRGYRQLGVTFTHKGCGGKITLRRE